LADRENEVPSAPDLQEPSQLITVYIVTYRRHEMLRRAISSVLAQTHQNLQVKVVNDDPGDPEVASIIEEFKDARLSLFMPVMKRGATSNFNLAFDEQGAEFVSLLEDDNWWEPTFLESQMGALVTHYEAPLVVGNERIWQELPDGQWRDTGQTIWTEGDVTFRDLRIEDICGSANICNSSMLIRVTAARYLKTPDTIPVDVTEHFRERQLGPRLLLNRKALVNYSETLRTARATDGETWGRYQCILIGSVFIAITDASARNELAVCLWNECASPLSPRAVTLLACGVAIREARALFWKAPFLSKLRFVIWVMRRPTRLLGLLSVRDMPSSELDYLVNAPLTRHFSRQWT